MSDNRPKTQSIKLNKCFRYVYRRGQYVNSEHLTLYYLPRKDGHNYLGVTVPRKLKGGVLRNRVKRQLRALYYSQEAYMALGYNLIMLGRYRPEEVKFADLAKEWRFILNKAELLEVNEQS